MTLRVTLCLILAAIGTAGSFAADPAEPVLKTPEPNLQAPIIGPLPQAKPSVPSVSVRTHNSIDNFLAARWRTQYARPAPLSDDATFARRAWLDIAGIIPTLDDLGHFLKRDRADRAKLIDELLDSSRYPDHWTAFWGDLLRENSRIQGAPDFTFRDYIRKALRENRPYDRWVREMIAASGSTDEEPATTFLLRNNVDPNELTVSVTQVFLGTQLKCVQCHDSNTAEPWTQDHFLGVAGFFAGTRRRLDHTEPFTTRDGKKRQRKVFAVRDLRKANGRFFTGAESALGPGRPGLADLVTRADNPYFARVAVNRLWAKLMGAGLVEPPDAFGPHNPPSHPQLLDYLALEFVESGYDLKHIIRLICNSRAYQLDSAGGYAPPSSDRRLFNKQTLRRLTAEQLWDSVLVCCGLDRFDPNRITFAIDQFYPPRPNSFLAVFEAHDRKTIHQRNTDATITQALTLMNGPFLNRAVQIRRSHPLHEWRRSGDPPRTIVRKLFRHTLSRDPTRRELKITLRHLPENDRHRDLVWSDVHWALINTREFMFIR